MSDQCGTARGMKALCRFVPLFLLLACVHAPLSFAISEDNYADVYRQVVTPYWEAGTPGTFSGVDSVQISFRVFNFNALKPALVILPGRQEPAIRYAEMIYDLRDLGYTIYVMDHRGQGFSGRMLTNSEIGHVEHFDDYLADFETFVRIVEGNGHPKRFLLAHSMGGAIAGEYLEKHPGKFSAAVLSAPMFQISTEPFSQSVAFGIAEFATLLGKGDHYALKQANFDLNWPFEKNNLTLSRSRFSKLVEIFTELPETRIGGPSYRWVREALKATPRIVRQAKKVSTPVLLLQAGSDSVVKAYRQDVFCERVLQCAQYTFPDSFHEIVHERDGIRNKAVSLMRDWFTSSP